MSKNVTGVCPHCRQRITVDISLPRVECPVCHKAIRKSEKTVEEQNAERERRWRKANGLPEVEPTVVPVEEVAAPVPEAAPVEEAPAAPVSEALVAETAASQEEAVQEEVVQEEAPVSEPQEELAAEPIPAEEPAAEAAPEMTDEEAMALAASMDEEPQEAEETPVTEAAPAEPVEEEKVDVNEISDEELALMDEAIPAETSAASDEPIVFSSISAEEEKLEPDDDEEEEKVPETEDPLGEGLKDLSSEDDTTQEELAVEEPAPETSDADAKEEDDAFSLDRALAPTEEPIAEVADEPVEVTPAAEEAAPAEENPVAEEKTAPVEQEVSAQGEPADAVTESEETEPAVAESEEQAPAEIDSEAEATSAAADETAPTAEALVEESAPTEEAPATEEIASAETEAPAAAPIEEKQETLTIEEPAEEAPAAEEAPKEEGPAYSEEDFAAAGEMDVRSYHAPKRPPVIIRTNTANSAATNEEPEAPAAPKKEKKGKKEKKEKNISTGTVFSRPIAVILAVFGFLFLLFNLTYGYYMERGILSALPATITDKFTAFLPTFGGERFNVILTGIYFAFIILIAAFAISGKRGKVGAILLLISSLFLALCNLWEMNGNKLFFIPYEGFATIFGNISKYLIAGGYAVMLLAVVLYLVAIISARDDFSISFLPSLPAVLLSILTLLIGAAIVIVPIITKVPFKSEVINYAILGIFVISVLLTLVGVHDKELSRSANAYFVAIFGVVFACLALVNVLLPIFSSTVNTLFVRFTAALPMSLAVAGVAFALADVRN